MNYSTAIFLVNKSARAMSCSYEPKEHGSPEITIFKTLDPTLTVGDYVVVPTGTRHKMTVVKIEEADVDFDVDCPNQVGWIIGRVDKELYEETLRNEQAIIGQIKSAEIRKKREDLAEKLLADKVEDLKALPMVEINGDH